MFDSVLDIPSQEVHQGIMKIIQEGCGPRELKYNEISLSESDSQSFAAEAQKKITELKEELDGAAENQEELDGAAENQEELDGAAENQEELDGAAENQKELERAAKNQIRSLEINIATLEYLLKESEGEANYKKVANLAGEFSENVGNAVQLAAVALADPGAELELTNLRLIRKKTEISDKGNAGDKGEIEGNAVNERREEEVEEKDPFNQ